MKQYHVMINDLTLQQLSIFDQKHMQNNFSKTRQSFSFITKTTLSTLPYVWPGGMGGAFESLNKSKKGLGTQRKS